MKTFRKTATLAAGFAAALMLSTGFASAAPRHDDGHRDSHVTSRVADKHHDGYDHNRYRDRHHRPPLRIEHHGRAPHRGMTWRAGHWNWAGHGWTWIPGVWIAIHR